MPNYIPTPGVRNPGALGPPGPADSAAIAAKIPGVSTGDRLETGNWVAVTRDDPCPICGKPDWCRRKPDNSAVLCHRSPAGGVVGWRQGTRTDSGTIWDADSALLRHGDSLVSPTPPRQRQKPSRPPNWSLLVANRVRVGVEHVERLAESLGVDVASLQALSTGWDSKYRAWTMPQRDAAGKIVGVALRYSQPEIVDGKPKTKGSIRGGKHGLFFDPAGWSVGRGPVFLVEGGSDVAALTTMGLAVVGRPSNVGGVVELRHLLSDLELDRPVVVVAERDHKPDGAFPGRDGAIQTARRLSEALGRRVGWGFPPDDAKDSRGWLVAVRAVDATPTDQLGIRFTVDVLSGCQWFDPPDSKPPVTGTPVVGVGGVFAAGPLPPELAPPPTPHSHTNNGKTASDKPHSVRSDSADLRNPVSARGENDPVSTSDPRVEVHYRAEDQAGVTDACLALMAGAFFTRSGQLVHVANAGDRRAAAEPGAGDTIVASSSATVADWLSRHVAFTVFEPIRVAAGEPPPDPPYRPKIIPTPRWLPERIAGMQVWTSLRELVGISHGAFLRPDGTVGGRTPGYDDQTGILVVGDPEPFDVVDHPTDDQVREAVGRLLEVVREFPFDGPAGKSVWLSSVLSTVARPAIDGPVPLHVFDASCRGSGKSLLAKVAAAIAGVEPTMESLTGDDTELDKKILALLSAGSRLVIFDNVAGTIGGATLDRFLTSTLYGGRVLGKTAMLKVPNLTTPIVTANNAAVGADTARRCLSLRLTPAEELPEEREFDVGDLERHVRGRRRELLAAALTILRHHAAGGFKTYNEAHHQADDGTVTTVPVRPKGSFEAWSRVVRHALIGAGLPDPETTARAIRAVDSRHANQASFVEALFAWRPGWNGSARQLVSEAFDDQVSGDAVEELRAAMLELAEERGRRGAVSPRLLGLVVRSLRERWFGSLRLVMGTHGKTGTSFYVESRG